MSRPYLAHRRISANHPPPPPPPPPPTPPPPTRTTVAFKPVILGKDVAQEEPPKEIEEIIETKADIGAETKAGNDEAPPSIEDHPSELAVVEEVKPEPER